MSRDTKQIAVVTACFGGVLSAIAPKLTTTAVYELSSTLIPLWSTAAYNIAHGILLVLMSLWRISCVLFLWSVEVSIELGPNFIRWTWPIIESISRVIWLLTKSFAGYLSDAVFLTSQAMLQDTTIDIINHLFRVINAMSGGVLKVTVFALQKLSVLISALTSTFLDQCGTDFIKYFIVLSMLQFIWWRSEEMGMQCTMLRPIFVMPITVMTLLIAIYLDAELYTEKFDDAAGWIFITWGVLAGILKRWSTYFDVDNCRQIFDHIQLKIRRYKARRRFQHLVTTEQIRARENAAAENASPECPICLQGYTEVIAKESFGEDWAENGAPIVLSCGHTAHKGCIRRWCRRSESCPICRTQLHQFD